MKQESGNRSAKESALRAGWLAQQDPGLQQEFMARSKLRRLERDEYLFSSGDDSNELFGLLQGSLVVSIEHQQEGEIVGHAHFPCDWFGASPQLARESRLMSVRARADSLLISISRNSIIEIVRAKPSAMFSVFAITRANHATWLRTCSDFLIRDAKTRFCARLLTLSGYHRVFPLAEPASIPLTQEELAGAANVSRHTAHKILNTLSEQNICEIHYGGVRVLNPEALAQIVSD